MKRQLLKLAVIVGAFLLWFTLVTSVRAQDQETVEPALATAVADQLATDFLLMTQTADALTPTTEPTDAVNPPNVNVDVNVEQPDTPPPVDPVADVVSRYGVLIIAVVAIVVLALVSRTGIVQAAAGIPKWAFDTGMFVVDNGLSELERRALLTTDPADDVVVAELRKEIAEIRKQVEENRVTAGAQRVTPTGTTS